jgi:hypothetical protein
MNIAAKGRELNKLLQISRILRRLQGASITSYVTDEQRRRRRKRQ